MPKTLTVGYRAGDLFEKTRRGERVSASWLQDDVTCHTLDVYDRHAIEKTHHAKAICAPHLPDGPWEVVKFRTGPKLMSGELALNLLQEIFLLKKKCACKVEVDFVGRERDKNDLLSKVKDDPERIRDFSARWKASVPGIAPLEFTSLPGCFCHRRLDEGGLALAEVASRELKDSQGEKRLLDMGCGCGLVGFLIAKAVKDVSLVMVDSHSRAVEAANINSENFSIPAEVILSDSGTPERMDGTFDVFVGNPPYYSDYRIADVFLETAKRALKPGGVCYTVCKNAAGLLPVQERYFPSAEIINRRGYAILKSTKEC